MQNLPMLLNRRTLILAGAGFVVLAILALGVQRIQGFQMLSSSPNGTSEHQYVSIVMTFNQDLAPTDNGVNQVVLDPQTEGTTIVKGKTITFEPLEPYDTQKVYRVTLKGPTSKSGSTLKDQSFSFRPTYVEYSKLPARYQKPKEDADVPGTYSADKIVIGGENALLTHGITADQMSILRQDFFTYFAFLKQEVRQLELTNIVQHVPGPRSANPAYFSFNVVIGGKTAYAGIMEYGLTSVRLSLTNPQTKAVVYDSKSFDPDNYGEDIE